MKKIFYRLCEQLFSDDLTGEAGKSTDGRWNYQGIPCIYLCDSPSRCLVESQFSSDPEEALMDLVFVNYEIPTPSIKTINVTDLPSDWNTFPSPPSTREFGSKLLTQNEVLLIEYPSAIFPAESIYLLNPRHELMKEVTIVGMDIFTPPMPNGARQEIERKLWESLLKG